VKYKNIQSAKKRRDDGYRPPDVLKSNWKSGAQRLGKKDHDLLPRVSLYVHHEHRNCSKPIVIERDGRARKVSESVYSNVFHLYIMELCAGISSRAEILHSVP